MSIPGARIILMSAAELGRDSQGDPLAPLGQGLMYQQLLAAICEAPKSQELRN